jgi:ATP phosphoribosyltransferase
MTLRIGLPKGSLQENTFALFGRAGYHISVGSRSYLPSLDDPEMEGVLIRAQEIPRYVEDGWLDAGLTGKDWIVENKAQVVEVCDLVYSKASSRPGRWVLAVADDSGIQSVSDLAGKRVATELVQVTKDYLAAAGVDAEVEYSWGATEVKTAGLVDAIVEFTETGRSLAANNLRVVDTVLTTNTKLIANREAWQDAWKRAKIENVAMLLQAALRAEEKVGIKMNAPTARLDEVLKVLPAMKNPTVSQLSDSEWCAIETVMDMREVRDGLIPKLKAAGAQDIIEYPLNKVIP